ncbi:hypothetical protein JVX88_11995 [Leptolyngbya sp. 7M]|nr:hypothetical protein [Leptolyngbya sp. 7M]QYO67443.1 hypothetical protein JVX88_11995 [Leptolyngbya sp. 7M]
MAYFDWAIVSVYLVYVIIDGIRLSKHTGTKEGFFLANRGLPWWAVGLSVMATQMSAITLVGTPGQAYTDGMRFLQFYYGLPFAMIILCVTVVPFFHRANIFTAYEYLEKRFDVRVRTLTSFFFLISRGLGVGTIISAPAIVLSIVFGWNLIATIFAIGLTTTIYTMLGGVQAVTWTDVKQMFIIFFGLGVAVWVIISGFPSGVSVADGLHLAGSLGKLETIDTRFDITEKYTIWSGLIGGLFLMLGYFGCDQSQVQRFLTARSVDEGRTSLLMSAFLKIPMQFFILLIGIGRQAGRSSTFGQLSENSTGNDQWPDRLLVVNIQDICSIHNNGPVKLLTGPFPPCFVPNLKLATTLGLEARSLSSTFFHSLLSFLFHCSKLSFLLISKDRHHLGHRCFTMSFHLFAYRSCFSADSGKRCLVSSGFTCLHKFLAILFHRFHQWLNCGL